MKINKTFFKNSKILSVDNFFKNVLYDKKYGYYNSKIPFGEKGDFITSPKISDLFSEIIAIWIVASWETFGKPKNFNIIELGPGDGSLTKILLRSFKRYPKFNSIKNFYLYEESKYLKKIQKKKFYKEIKWISNFDQIKKGPVIFFGNEFFDAIPIKQFKKNKNFLFEKYYSLGEKCKVEEVFKKASTSNIKAIKTYKSLGKLNFIEFPKLGLQLLKKMTKKIFKLNGCILLVDYGYKKSNNENTLQSVMKHKKNKLLDNLGKADVTAHVNFSLLNEFFLNNDLKVKNLITQKEFLENMGIIERAKILAKKMKFTQQSDLYLRMQRLLSPKYMGELFKVILAYKSNKSNFAGFK